jgi:hypothetical protein
MCADEHFVAEAAASSPREVCASDRPIIPSAAAASRTLGGRSFSSAKRPRPMAQYRSRRFTRANFFSAAHQPRRSRDPQRPLGRWGAGSRGSQRPLERWVARSIHVRVEHTASDCKQRIGYHSDRYKLHARPSASFLVFRIANSSFLPSTNHYSPLTTHRRIQVSFL